MIRLNRILPFAIVVGLALAGLALAPIAHGQQMPDTSFDTRVARPAHAKSHPKILFDEAHHNFHTTNGRYWVFCQLVTHDGCAVKPNKVAFSSASLAGNDLVVIANALGAEDMDDSTASNPAFTGPEDDALRDWVRAGGALLLIADHAPMGSAARDLAARFGVDMSNAVTIDTTEGHQAKGDPSRLVFSRENGLLGDHAILRGRDSTERVSRVVAFTGQSLGGPEGSAVLLQLSPGAKDIRVRSLADAESATEKDMASAAGRTMGVALAFGKGRVVVLGEAAMLSAQVAGPARRPMGMNMPGSDDRQFALNVERWLTRALD